MAYEPFIWIFAYAGVAALLRPLLKRIRVPTISPIAGLTLLLVVALGLIFVRSQRLVGTTGDRRAGIAIGKTRSYVDEVVSTFGDLRRFLETLPRDRTLLVGAYGTVGRWKAISGLNYYSPDSALSVAAGERDVYVLVECGTREICQDFENWDSDFRAGLDRLGLFSYERVFSHLTQHAKARVYRLRNVQ